MRGLSLDHVRQGGIQVIHHGRGSRPTSFANRFQFRLAAAVVRLRLPLFELSLVLDAVSRCCFSS